MLELLKNIGLTESEAKVYIALIDLGETTIGPIADKSQVSYSKIYILLEKLIGKGLVHYILKGKTKYFAPSDPKKILEYLEQKKSNLDILTGEVEELLPKIELKLNNLKEQEEATIYEGYEGMKSIYFNGLENLQENDEILVLGASLGIYTDDKYKLLFKQINSRRQAKKIKYRIIFNDKFRNDDEVKFWQKQPRTEVRFLLDDTQGSVNIQGNKVLIIYWEKQNVKIFCITSSIISDSFRKYFEVIWKIAKR